MKDGISVIICCFNSSKRLKPTLEHLYFQRNISFSEWEIIVVNNASTDDTITIATEIWNSFTGPKPPFKIISEKRQGLSLARNAGINEANFKYVLLCDDDNWLADDYLTEALNIMRPAPMIGALGGIGTPVFEDIEPPFFWENQFHTLAVGPQWKEEGDITETREVLYGAGMVLNKEAYNILLNKFQFKFQVSDRKGNTLLSSGDHEVCLALKRIGYKIFYSESLRFRHYIPKRRTTISYYKKLFLSFGKSNAMLHAYNIDSKSVNAVKNDYRYICLRCCKNIVKTWFTLVISGYYFGSNKYIHVDQLHFLYKNIGLLTVMILKGNSFKQTIKENRLFHSTDKRLTLIPD